MSEIYNKEYYQQYDKGTGYASTENYEPFFKSVAQRIVDDFAPKTVLDIGCAWGYLVSALRDLGVKAYGIDISEYAISMVRSDIKPYCAALSVTGDLPQTFPSCFDLVVSIEMIEHLYEEDCLAAIEKICSYSNRILLSSSSDDVTDETHFNVRQPEYWVKQFAKFGFFNKVNYKPGYISKDSFCFERTEEIYRVVENYEHKLRLLLQELTAQKDYLNSIDQKEETHYVSVFYDTGNGFNENEKTIFSFKGSHFKQEIDLPPNTLRLRIDPTEGEFCVVRQPEILSEKGMLARVALNGYEIADYCVFLTKDAQLVVEGLQTEGLQIIEWVKVEFALYTFSDNVLLGLFSHVKEYINECNAMEQDLMLVKKAAGEMEQEAKASIDEAQKVIQQMEQEKQAAIEEARRVIQQMKQEKKAEIEEAQRVIHQMEQEKNAADNEAKSIIINLEQEKASLKDALAKNISVLEEQLLNETKALEEQTVVMESLLKEMERHNREQDENAILVEKLKEELKIKTEEQIKKINEEKDIIIQKLEDELDEEQYLRGVIELESKQNAERCEVASNKRDEYMIHYKAAIDQRNEYRAQSELYLAQFQAIQKSTFWRVTKPARVVLGGVKKTLRVFPPTRLFYKGLSSLRRRGFRVTLQATKRFFSHKKQIRASVAAGSVVLSEVERQAQEQTKFNKNIKISVIVPLYNTPEDFLCEMIESVMAQTYANWELCLADGSEKEHTKVGTICKLYEKKDNRIRYKKLSYNGGISYNTNKALEMVTGEYVGLLDHDDLLHPAALFEVMLAIDNKDADFIYTDEMTFEGQVSNPITMHFKPDFAIDTLRANNYICHFSCFSKALLDKAGWFRPECDGSQDYDIVLRLTEQAKSIVHIPKLLYFWRSHANSVASDISVKPYCITAAKVAIDEHLKRCGIEGRAVEAPRLTSLYKIEYALTALPLISIIIPNKDSRDLLRTCIDSIVQQSTYTNWEIIVVENNSETPEIFKYYKKIVSDERIRVVTWTGKFNYSAINNYGVSFARGEQLLFLNNDTKVISPGWLEEMLMFSQRKDVGAVGAKLYYPNDTIQHAGVVIGILGTAGHVFYNVHKDNLGYMGRLYYAQNYSAVTAACLMTKRVLFDEVNGFEEEFEVAYSDVDYCLKLRRLEKLNVFTPFAELYHFESISRGSDQNEGNKNRWLKEVELFKTKWHKEIEAGDPYFNPNFRLDRSDFEVKS